MLALQRRLEEAVPCFERAIQPRAAVCRWRTRSSAQALAVLGRGREADAAFEEFFDRDAGRARSRSRWITCAPIARTRRFETLRAAVREDPDNVDAMRVLAQLYMTRRRAAVATPRRCCGGSTALAPDLRWPGRCWGILQESNRHREAIECFREASRLDPASAVAWSGLGVAYAHAGDVDRAIEAFERSIAVRPDIANVQLGYGHALKTAGDQAAALRAYRAAIAAKPDFGEVYWSMANLKVFRFEDAEVAAMEAAGRTNGPERERRHSLPLRARRRPMRTGATTTGPGITTTRATSASARRCSTIPSRWSCATRRSRTSSRPSSSRNSPDRATSPPAPIFIVGLPRSGSTLVEQILASHSQVEGTAELPTLMHLADSIGRYRHGQEEVPRVRARPAWPGPQGLRPAVPRGSRGLPRNRCGRSSRTRCRTTSRTSGSCT